MASLDYYNFDNWLTRPPTLHFDISTVSMFRYTRFDHFDPSILLRAAQLKDLSIPQLNAGSLRPAQGATLRPCVEHGAGSAQDATAGDEGSVFSELRGVGWIPFPPLRYGYGG